MERRTRAVRRFLKTVETLDAPPKGPVLLELVAPDLLDEEGENDDAETADDAA